MNAVNVGIGEYCVSMNKEDLIKTYALGSCVAVIAYDRDSKTAGMMHIALPESSVNEERARTSPGYFADTGLPVFLKEMKWYSGMQNRRWIKIVGGASIMDDSRRFDIGKRNVLAIKKCLWKNRFGIIREEIGGKVSRTVSVSVETGELIVSSKGEKWTL